jgi:hypothetical protein
MIGQSKFVSKYSRLRLSKIDVAAIAPWPDGVWRTLARRIAECAVSEADALVAISAPIVTRVEC